MSRAVQLLLGGAVLALLAPTWARAEAEIGSPGFPPSKVADDGALIEPWGTIRLVIVTPEGAQTTGQRIEQAPMPVAVTRIEAGPVALEQSAYRAPVWPSGVDVIEGVLVNHGEAAAEVQLRVDVPEAMEIGERLGSLGGAPALALPKGLEPVREERAWGCTGGVRAIPGWARPRVECDPAFRNISAGMGGVPITYRFAVEPGAQRTVVLGFCESHHPSAGLRPLKALVEGTEARSIDPVDAWGRHGPGVVRFDAADADGNGRLEVAVAPHPIATDRNTILNVIWVFAPGAAVDEARLIAGELNGLAERYVDVGGENDQALYKPGDLQYALRLGPGARREFFFLVRSPGAPSVPDPSLWDQSSLRKAAADVWRDRWEEVVAAEPASE